MRVCVFVSGIDRGSIAGIVIETESGIAVMLSVVSVSVSVNASANVNVS